MLASGRHCRRGGGDRKIDRGGGDFWGYGLGAMSTFNGQRDGKASAFVSIIPPVVGSTIYQGMAFRGTGDGTEWSAGIGVEL